MQAASSCSFRPTISRPENTVEVFDECSHLGSSLYNSVHYLSVALLAASACLLTYNHIANHCRLVLTQTKMCPTPHSIQPQTCSTSAVLETRNILTEYKKIFRISVMTSILVQVYNDSVTFAVDTIKTFTFNSHFSFDFLNIVLTIQFQFVVQTLVDASSRLAGNCI